MTNLSRRSVLAGAAGLAVAPFASLPRLTKPRETLDIAIVGAGVSGCYAAWRLSRGVPGKKVGVFEFSNRIGGRLWSVKPKGMTHQVAELGGMRIASNQTPLLNLTRLLNLTHDPYPATLPEDVYFLRGIRSKAKDLVASPAFGYHVPKAIEGKSPGDLAMLIVKVATGRDDWTPKTFNAARATMAYNGTPLYKLPYKLVVADIVGYGGLQFLEDTVGYGLSNCSMDEYCEEVALGLAAKGYKHVREGYDEVPGRLAKQAVEQGVRFEFERELIDVATEDDATVLSFATKAGQTTQVVAKKVIITIPDTAYKMLPMSSPLRKAPPLQALLNGLTGNPATKVYVNFPNQWWKPLGITAGRSITDLPIRQCFYLPDPSGRGLTLSPYASGHNNEGFFAPILPEGKQRLGGDSRAARSIVKQLELVHGISIPAPSELIYRTFDGGHFGFGWALWNPGVQGWDLAAKARAPIPGHGLFLCGQSTAAQQGWVMDSIASVERVLRDHFALSRPGWWPESYPAV